MRHQDRLPRTNNDEQLRAVLSAAFPARSADAEIWERVEAKMTPPSARPHPTRRPLRFALGFIATACLAVLALALTPTEPAASILEQMDAAMTDVQSFHMVYSRIENDKRHKMRVVWQQGDRWRIEENDSRVVRIFADGKHWVYDAEANQATLERRAIPFGYASQGYTLTDMARNMVRNGSRDRLRVTGSELVGGRLARRILIEHESGERTVVLVDQHTDLPLQSETQVEQNGRWMPVMASTFQFNKRLPEHLFQPRFPPHTRILDLDAERTAWKQRLAPGIARQRIENRTVTIRDIQVNAEGDVFLLYTASGRTDAHFDLELHDDCGTTYRIGSGFRTQLDHPRPEANLWPGLEFDGEKLQGIWWIPVVPQQPWQSRRFTLTFRIATRQQDGPKSGSSNARALSRSAVFTLDVQRPTCELLPDYAPSALAGSGSLCDGNLCIHDVPRERAASRARYYRNIARDPEQALHYYRELTEATKQLDQAHGEKLHDPDTWLALYEILRDLERTDEARQALIRAREEVPYPYRKHGDFTWRQIQAVLKREGLAQ